MKKLFYLLLIPALFFSIWECSETNWILPKPSEILNRIWEIRTVLWGHFLITLQEIALSLTIAIVTAFPAAYLMCRFGPLSLMLQPFFIAFQCIPLIALAPLLILWFGWGYTAIVIPSTLMIFFPMSINLKKGFSSVPKGYLDLFQLHGAGPLATFFHLQLPCSVPYFFAALRLAFATATMAAVSGEWVGGQKGLGVFLLEAKRSYDLKSAFAALFVIVFLSLGLYCLSILLESRLGRRYALTS